MTALNSKTSEMMEDEMSNEKLLEAARKAIEELFGDTSVSVQTAIENLQSLRDEIEINIHALQADL